MTHRLLTNYKHAEHILGTGCLKKMPECFQALYLQEIESYKKVLLWLERRDPPNLFEYRTTSE